MKKSLAVIIFIFSIINITYAQRGKSYTIFSPDKNLSVTVNAGEKITWELYRNSLQLITPSAIGLIMEDGSTIGNDVTITSAKERSVSRVLPAVFYKKDSIRDNYNELTIKCSGNFSIIFRVFDDGAAYRFVTTQKDSLTISREVAEFNFANDDSAYIPYSNGDMYFCSFENTYQHIPLSKFVKDSLAFLPVLVEINKDVKALITEADLEDFPGMFLTNAVSGYGLMAVHAPYVLEQKENERHPVQALVARRANYIAKTAGTRNFPWRVVVVSTQDKDLLNNDMVYRLASPSRVNDISWIRPGKVAWDWWNDWNISHVPFKAGINTATYKYYIDFASANHIEYIILDEGWSDARDVLKASPGIDLPEIIRYAAQKNVGVWLWMGSYPLYRNMEEIFTTYSKMGVKGFKIDFMDRDDQPIVDFYYKVAKMGAENNIMIDFHGAYKPTGIQHTYPNVVNIEGVYGMEQLKFSYSDQATYDVSIPFIRMVAGCMDYTPGAMRNATKEAFRSINSMPMSQGTRCHQLAMYVMYEAPFAMLSDNPTAYIREQESTVFITSIPTTFDETLALDGKVAKYCAIARRKGSTWYVSAMNNWTPRSITLDLFFLKNGHYKAIIFKDGVNADRDATDYVREVKEVSSGDKLTIHLAPGGGWAARFEKR